MLFVSTAVSRVAHSWLTGWLILRTSEIVRVFKARRTGKGKWMAHCPIHGRDRTPSLEIKEGKNVGTTIVGCYAGCNKLDVLAAVGLTMCDLFAESRTMTPFILQQLADEDRLKILERRHGLFIMLQAVDVEKRHYWAGAERNTAIEIRELRTRIYPVEAYYLRRNENTQRIINEYGMEELWQCVPVE